MKSLRILIADDHPLVRKGVRTLIGERKDWQVCGEAESGNEAVALAMALRPDIIVMDVSMSPVSGIQATREILEFAPQTRVLMLTMHDAEPLVREALEAGAQGYVLKSDADCDLIVAIAALARGGTFFSKKIARPEIGDARRDGRAA